MALAAKLEDKSYALEKLLGAAAHPEHNGDRLLSAEVAELTEQLFTPERYMYKEGMALAAKYREQEEALRVGGGWAGAWGSAAALGHLLQQRCPRPCSAAQGYLAARASAAPQPPAPLHRRSATSRPPPRSPDHAQATYGPDADIKALQHAPRTPVQALFSHLASLDKKKAELAAEKAQVGRARAALPCPALAPACPALAPPCRRAANPPRGSTGAGGELLCEPPGPGAPPRLGGWRASGADNGDGAAAGG
jgi:hypothetical protein